jgi:hypothetical protein
MFEEKVLWRIVTGRCRKLHNEGLHELYSSPDKRCGYYMKDYEMAVM